jgi:hypothetical protein
MVIWWVCRSFGLKEGKVYKNCLLFIIVLVYFYGLQLFVSAMGPPGGGRNDISSRMVRHMNIVTIDEFDDATMLRIFGTICDMHFGKGFDPVFMRNGKVSK